MAEAARWKKCAPDTTCKEHFRNSIQLECLSGYIEIYRPYKSVGAPQAGAFIMQAHHHPRRGSMKNRKRASPLPLWWPTVELLDRRAH